MENQTSQQPEKTGFRRWLEAAPVLQFVGAGIIGLCATWTTIQLTQNSQAAEIRETRQKITTLETQVDRRKEERDKQIDDLRRSTVTREVFDERTNTILKQIELLRAERQADREYFERILLTQNR